MPGVQPPRSFREKVAFARDVVLVLLGAGVIVVAIWSVLSRVGDVVLVLILSTMFSMFLSPSVKVLNRYMGRPWAVLIVVTAATALFLGGGVLVITVLIGQLAGLAANLPHELTQVANSASHLLVLAKQLGVSAQVSSLEGRLVSNVGTVSRVVLTQSLHFLLGLVSALGDAVITIFITVYLLLDTHRIQAAILRLVPTGNRSSMLDVQTTVTRVIRGYLRGQLMLSLVVGLGFGLGSWFIGLPYPFALGVFAGLMELIPLLGPVLAAIIPFLLALFGHHPYVQVLEVVVLYTAVHVLESQILVPRIMRSQVGLHPVLSVVALMTGALLLGIWGAVFAVPVAGIIVAAWIAGVGAWRRRLVLQSPLLMPEPVRGEDAGPRR
ncbi:MAG: AI-2E family transporter [Firmicutes bacterium]|jgi:predicted PurR-regulated permease PerM|nr:AI-2E family transporter [Bacillota bacterium]